MTELRNLQYGRAIFMSQPYHCLIRFEFLVSISHYQQTARQYCKYAMPTYFPIIYGSPQLICWHNWHSVVKYRNVSIYKNIVTGQQFLSSVFHHSRLVELQNGGRCPPFILHVISHFLCHSITPSSSSIQGTCTLANQELISHAAPSQVKVLVLQMSPD
jgi:hypothetical protein